MMNGKYIPAKTLALLFGTYMLVFSILPADYVFVSRILGLSSASAMCSSPEGNAFADLQQEGNEDAESEEKEEKQAPPIIEEEDIYAHQALLALSGSSAEILLFHWPYSEWCDNISAITTPPPDLRS